MDHRQLGWITNFIWGIADDVLRDVYVRGKYRDIILPMTVIRRLDAVLEPTKEKVLDEKKRRDEQGLAHPEEALKKAASQAFYNVSPFTLRDLRSRSKSQQLRADFEAYLDGFSDNVAEILEKFEFRNQIPKLVNADILGHLIEKFLDNRINLGPKPLLNGDGSVRLPALDNHAMGTIFEELIRRFNEENNEEAGEHFTPRDVVKLMADLILLPIVIRANNGIAPRYLYRVTTLAEFRALGTDAMTGSAGQQRVPPEFVRDFPSIVPPLVEQNAIIRFLDRADGYVSRLIRAKQCLIELLNEQKQAIIHRAVTRGLDPDAPMKPTGLDGVPEVPEHWEVGKLKTHIPQVAVKDDVFYVP